MRGEGQVREEGEGQVRKEEGHISQLGLTYTPTHLWPFPDLWVVL